MSTTRNDAENFRIKLDLSQFYNDERKLSYIYMDKLKITNVLHLQMKIQNIFGITEPLYLMINSVFLPANEDIRIIRKDEVVVVQSSYPGSDKSSTANDRVVLVEKKIDSIAGSVLHCEKHKQDSESTELTVMKDNISISDALNLNSDMHYENHRRTQKRIRRRKKNNKNGKSISKSDRVHLNYISSLNYQPPKVQIDSPNVNHLKFIWDDLDGERESNEIIANSSPSRPVVCSSEIINLDALLSLRNNKIPLTFSGKRQVRTSAMSSRSPESSSNECSFEENNVFVNSTICPSINSSIDYSKINVVEYPIYKEVFEVGDVVAFRTLILNEHYSPVLSDYILARIITKDLSSTYSCEILVGQEQLKIPDGKFALPENKNEHGLNGKDHNGQKLLDLKHSHLNQPRLIYRETLIQ